MINFVASDIRDIDVGILAAFADNGEPGNGHFPLVPDSPAIDAGNPADPGSGGDACEATDQLGTPRPADGDCDGTAVCDIGAIEFVPEVGDVNAEMSGIPDRSTYAFDPTPVPGGPAGTFSFTAEFCNTGLSNLTCLRSVTTTLSGGNTLVNRNPSTPAGVGSELSFSLIQGYADGVLSPGRMRRRVLSDRPGRQKVLQVPGRRRGCNRLRSRPRPTGTGSRCISGGRADGARPPVLAGMEECRSSVQGSSAAKSSRRTAPRARSVRESRLMLTLDQELRPHPDAVETELDENELALLHLESKKYYSLNATGKRIWQGLRQGRSLREISQRLQNEFQVDAETADRCVLELVNELVEHNLVQSAD